MRERAAESPRPARPARWREALVGLVLLLVLTIGLVAAFRSAVRGLRGATRSLTTSARAARIAEERTKSAEALTIVSSLATAVDSLARVSAVSAGSVGPAPDPPAPTEFASPTACMQSYLPEVDLPKGSLDFVCEETDFWTLDWKVRAHVATKPGAGARLWNRLGPYSLAALASMRKGCCVDPPYLQAKVPALWCGILRDTLRGFQAVPSTASVHEFETTMKCLEGRGMRLPPSFAATPPDRAHEAFGQFLKIARARSSSRPRVEPDEDL